MKKSGICPKCKSTDIMTDYGQGKRGERVFIAYSSFGAMEVSCFICMQCGFLEEYVDENDLHNTGKAEKLRKNWKPHQAS